MVVCVKGASVLGACVVGERVLGARVIGAGVEVAVVAGGCCRGIRHVMSWCGRR